MPLINENLKTENLNQPAQNANAFQPSQKGLITLPPALMQIIPWIPFALEAMTGQKIPQIGGTMGEIQSSLQQLQFQVSQVLTQQQQLWNKLESLENNASQQLTNLSQQVKDFRLLATETKRSLELNSRPRLNESENYE